MKILLFSICFMTAVMQIATSQTITISGEVKSAKGAPLPFAFVQDKQIKSAVYTDSLGNFNITTAKGSTLQFSLNGYADTSVDINKNNKIGVVLRYNGSVKENVTDNIRTSKTDVAVSDAFSGHTNTVSAYNNAYTEGGQMQFNGGSFPIAREKEEAHGSRYYFTTWGDGTVINSKNELVKDPAYVFNYDKMGGNLIVTHDKKDAITIDRDEIQSFTIYNESIPFLFERVPAIDANHFMQVLSKGDKYKILKLTKTKFVKADFETNGITSSGNQYDEFVDENTYYVLNVQSNQSNKFILKKKSIKDAFSGDNKVDSYLSQHKDDINDQYLKNLGGYLNN